MVWMSLVRTFDVSDKMWCVTESEMIILICCTASLALITILFASIKYPNCSEEQAWLVTAMFSTCRRQKGNLGLDLYSSSYLLVMMEEG